MYVRNVAGYNFAFKYRDVVMYIPFDGKIYSIPDDSGTYRELKVIPAMHIRTQSVTYINKDGSIASEKISGHKRRGRPPKKVDPDKPLKGVKLKRKPEPVKEEVVPVEEDNSIMQIDLSAETSDIKEVKEEPTIEEKVEEKKVTKKTTTTKKKAPEKKTTSTGKKRGRPRKNPQ